MSLDPLGGGIVAASVAAAVGALYLFQYLYARHGKSGANWFMGNIASVALFCLSYGIALLVFDPTIRVALEVIAFICVCFMGPFFLAFGLDYTGRGDLIRTPLFGLVALVPLLSVGLAVTNPVHQLVWTDFQFEPVFGLATATYTFQPWGIFAFAFSIGTAAIGSLLLIGAIVSYGPLYRREATAVILSTVPPSVGVALWLFGGGPIPELHLTGPLMLIHVTLDAYAFVGTHMFATNPATQRMAERTGLDSLSEPVFVLDAEHQLVKMNDSAEDAFPEPVSFPVPLETVLGVTLETLRETGELTAGTDRSDIFAVSYTELTDSRGELVGSMLVLYDVTEQRQREQQLAVLNRVLRHNLRNETTVISGYAELLEGVVTDPQHAKQADTIAAASDRLNAIAEKVATFEDVHQRSVHPEPVAIEETIDSIVQQYTATHSESNITLAVEPPTLQVRTDPVFFTVVLSNFIENAIVHSDSPDPLVSITAAESPAQATDVCVEIRDTNDPIPELEIETIRAGTETPLQHGQGIGLWIAYWCTRKLGGEIRFAYDNGNVVTVTV